MATASASSLSEDDKVFGPRTNNNNEAYNGKLGGVVNKPNIWWLIELIKSENTHFTLQYHRLIRIAMTKKVSKKLFRSIFEATVIVLYNANFKH
jgi:hypothetical protein